MIRAAHPDRYRQIYRVVACIPRGRVATYGQIAQLAGLPGRARLVGQALAVLTDSAIPWQRVVNSRGEISPRADGPAAADLQRRRLEAEGVRFDAAGRIALARHQWWPEFGGESV